MATKSHVVTLGYQVGSEAISKSYTKTAESEQNLSFDLPSTTTPVEVSFTLTAPGGFLKAFYLNSEQLAQIKTNSTSSPGDTFTLKANKPLIYTDDFSLPAAGLFTTNITKIYFYNTSGTTSAITGYALIDALP